MGLVLPECVWCLLCMRLQGESLLTAAWLVSFVDVFKYVTSPTGQEVLESSAVFAYDRFVDNNSCIALVNLYVLQQKKQAVWDKVNNYLGSRFDTAGPFVR